MEIDLLEDLDDTQRDAVTSTSEPLAILAGAGSGKTRVLTRRIAWRAAQADLKPSNVLAVTFTRKAANELKARLGQLGLGYPEHPINIGTFHSIAYGQLHQRWAERGIRPPEMLDRKIGFVSRLLPRSERGRDSNLALDATSELEWATARALTPETYPRAVRVDGRTPPLPVPQMAELMERYAVEKRTRRLVDFDDLLLLCIRDLGDAEYAERVRERHQHFFVDEFQDINPLQYKLLTLWLGERSDLCVVGDPNQAIYGWNGADASYLRWFNDRFGGGQTIRLGHNYRSTPQVVAAGHIVLPSNVRSDDPPQAHLPDGPKPTVSCYGSDRYEADALARLAKKKNDEGVAWSEQAVLVRTNAQTATIAKQFSSAGVPIKVRGGTNLIDQPEVKGLLRSLGQTTQPLSSAIDQLRDQISEAAPQGESPSAAELDRHANRQALLTLASDRVSIDPEASTLSFIEWVRTMAEAEGKAGDNNAVDILTFHAAKGLEWTAVYIAGVERGYVPIGYADDPVALAEERRLLHVAITRAKEFLHLSWAQERTFGDKSAKRTRSPYLDAIDPPIASSKPTKPAGSTKTRSMADRATELPVDDPYYKKLTEWRSNTAKEESVPAYIVFNNRTLAAIARTTPGTKEDLLEVPGIGPAKAERYGDEVLAIIND